MAGLARKTALIFAGSLAPTGNIEAFGSKAGGSPVWTNDPQVIQTAQWLQGLAGSLATGQAPYLEDDNGFRLVTTYLLAYLFGRGIPEWDSNVDGSGHSLTTYNTGDWVRRGPTPLTANVTPYVCQADGITSDPLVDTNNWFPLAKTLSGPNIPKAWVLFDGTTGSPCTLLSGFNVTSVTKTATGRYLVNFSTAMPVDGSGNGIYGFTGSCGTQNGAAAAQGDNDLVIGYTGGTGVKTATQCTVSCWEAGTTGPGGSPPYSSVGFEDSTSVFVVFYG